MAQGGTNTGLATGGAVNTNGGNAYLQGGQNNPSQGGSSTSAQGGSSSKGGGTATGGSATGNGGSTAKGGATGKGGTTTSTGGAAVSATGGAATTATGGAANPTATAASCTTDFMTLLTGTANWIPFDAAKTCGMQGSIYGYGDGTSCTIPTAGVCTSGKCCISGKTAPGTTGTTDYSNYGCGLGFDLNASSGTASVKSAYTATQGPAKGFKLTFSGTVAAGQKIRIKYASSATPPVGGTAPYVEVTSLTAASATFLFADAKCPTWATAAQCSLPTAGPYSLQVELVGGGAETAVGTFTDFCLTSLTPVY